jgi:TonB family protein
MSERDGFSQCLVDGDKQSVDRAKMIRQKALLISIIFEAALVAALLLWPLITQGLPPQQFLVTPAPPYHGGSNSPQGGHHGSPLHHKTDGPTMMYPVAFQPMHFREHAQSLSSDEAPAIGSGFGPGNMPGFGIGDGESIPGGGESNMRPVPPQPKPKPTPEKPRPMSEGVMEAALLNKVQPQYPVAARLMHIAGTVRLQAIIGTDGRVRDVEVLSGNPILAQAALAAVREWRYRPTELNHEIVEVETEVTVNFILQQ